MLACSSSSSSSSFWIGLPSASSSGDSSSAGLAVASEMIYDPDGILSVYSDEAVTDPCHAYINLSGDFLNLPWMQGVINDSHFHERDRMGRIRVAQAIFRRKIVNKNRQRIGHDISRLVRMLDHCPDTIIRQMPRITNPDHHQFTAQGPPGPGGDFGPDPGRFTATQRDGRKGHGRSITASERSSDK